MRLIDMFSTRSARGKYLPGTSTARDRKGMYQLVAHHLAGFWNVLVVITLLSIGLGPLRMASLGRRTGAKLVQEVDAARALVKRAAVLITFGLWR